MKNAITHWLTVILKPIVEVRPGERLKTLVMFSYFFLIIGTIWVLKPVRNALFLEDLGADNLRFVYIAEGIFLIGIVWGFAQLSKIVSRKALYGGVLGFYVVCLIGFWFLFHMKVPYLSVLFYVWVSSYSITMTTLFFTLANDIFNPQEAKRLFGLILSGGSLGGFLGAWMTEKLVVLLTTENLLLIVAGFVSLCGALVIIMWQRIAPAEIADDSPASDKSDKPAASLHSAGKLLRGSKYLMMLAGIIIIAKVASAVVDNQYNGIVEIAIQGKDARTAFFGGFGKWLNLASFVSQLFFTAMTLRHFGVGFSLWILPVGLLVASAAGVFWPVLFVGAALKLIDGSGNYSIQQACREILYLPLPSYVRYKVKPAIDMLGYRLAKSFGGIYIAILAPLLGLTSARLGILVLILMPIWAFLVWKMKKGYSDMLRKNIMEEGSYETVVESKKATDVLRFLHDEKSFHEVKALLRQGSSSAKKAAATAFLTYTQNAQDLGSVRKRVETLIEEEAFEIAEETTSDDTDLHERDVDFLKALPLEGEVLPEKINQNYLKHSPETVLVKLGDVLRDQGAELQTKRRAIRLLSMIPKQETVDLLLHNLAGAQDHALRFVILQALTRLQDENALLEVNRFLVKTEIEREVRIHQRVNKIQIFLKAESADYPHMDSLEAILKAIADESVERIFYFLELLYPQEMMLLIHRRIYEKSSSDMQKQAYASELLTNTVEASIFKLIQKVFISIPASQVSESQMEELLQKGLGSRDRWFTLVSQFIVSEFNLESRWTNLAKKV